MEKIWTDLKAHFAAHSPQVLTTLNPPIEEAEVVAFEKEFDIRLPEDYRASLFIHNGQPITNYIHFLVTADSYWLWSLADVHEESAWRVNVAKQPLEMIPFARSGGSSRLYLNVTTDSDQYGKIYYFDEFTSTFVDSLTFTEFMADQLERMQSGKTVADGDGWYELS